MSFYVREQRIFSYNISSYIKQDIDTNKIKIKHRYLMTFKTALAIKHFKDVLKNYARRKMLF